MKKLISRRPSPAMVVAFVALMSALAPSAAALKGVNLVSSNDIIRGAVKKSDAGRDSVGPNEALEDTDPGGGFTGSQIREDTLDPVPQAFGLFSRAMIDGATARLVRGKAVTGFRTTGPGRYEVDFDPEIDDCNYLATLTGSDAGTITVDDHATNRHTVVVRTFEGGTLTNRSFHLGLAC
jgi:hypothetical protein